MILLSLLILRCRAAHSICALVVCLTRARGAQAFYAEIGLENTLTAMYVILLVVGRLLLSATLTISGGIVH